MSSTVREQPLPYRPELEGTSIRHIGGQSAGPRDLSSKLLRCVGSEHHSASPKLLRSMNPMQFRGWRRNRMWAPPAKVSHCLSPPLQLHEWWIGEYSNQAFWSAQQFLESVMEITRDYQNNEIPASRLRRVRDYLNVQNSSSLGTAWGHKIYEYLLHYGPDEVAKCIGIAEVESTIAKLGDTVRWAVHFESRTGRLLKLDATDPAFIRVRAANCDRTIPFLERVEALLELKARPKRVFVSHGRSKLWLEVARYIEIRSSISQRWNLRSNPMAGDLFWRSSSTKVTIALMRLS
jgi:hypothetical protein